MGRFRQFHRQLSWFSLSETVCVAGGVAADPRLWGSGASAHAPVGGVRPPSSEATGYLPSTPQRGEADVSMRGMSSSFHAPAGRNKNNRR